MIYSKDRLQLLLQVEVQSSPMEQAVSKAIRGAADILCLERCRKLDFKKFIVFALPKCTEKSAVKITVEWDKLHFFYELNVICQLI